MTWFLDLRATEAGGHPAASVSVRRDTLLCRDDAALRAAVQGRDVLIGTHGFNVNRKDGIASLTAWSSLLDLGPNGCFVGVLWPGDSRWLPVVDYPVEGGEAMDSARLLAPYLDRAFRGAASLSFASHSLGARMVLETIRHLQRPVRRLVLMAGAIDDNCLTGEYRDAAARVEAISVLASRSDLVLKIAFPVGNPLSGLISPGHPYWQGALGHDGPDDPCPANVRAGWQIPNGWDYGHGDYLGGTPPALRPPVLVPDADASTPTGKPAWSAGFVSTRLAS